MRITTCAAAILTIVLAKASLRPDQSRDIVLAAWQAVTDHFYDPQFRGLDWESTREALLKETQGVQSAESVERIVRSLFIKLNNSHSGLSTPEERVRREAMLRLALDRAGNQLFVAYVLPSQRNVGLQYGDEVMQIDGVRPAEIRLPVKNFHHSVAGNPIYGSTGSTAVVSVRAREGVRQVAVARSREIEPGDAYELKPVDEATLYIRFNALGGAELSPDRLRALFRQASRYRAIILDLRDCPGGDMKASAVLASILFGPGKDFYTITPRNADQPSKVYSKKPPLTEEIEPDVQSGRPVLIRTYAEDVQYAGRIAVLANTQTGSEPENLVAAVKAHSRGRVFGSRTQGATHGWSRAVPLPHKFGAVAIPYTRTIMPDGKEYEGIGIAPNVEVTNTPADYERRRDAVLETAIRYLKAPHERH